MAIRSLPAAAHMMHAHDRHHAETGARRGVARAVEQVVVALVAGDPGLEERVGHHRGDEDAGDDQRRQQHVERDGEAQQRELEEAGEQPQPAVDEADVEVRLGACRHRGGVVGTVVPDRVDRHGGADQDQDAEDDEEEAARLGRVDRQQREADDVLVRAAGAGVLGVLVQGHQPDVGADEREEQAGDEQHVGDEQAGDDRLAGELAAEDEERQVGADHGDRLHDAVDDAQAVARQQVVGQEVAGETGQQRDRGEHRAQIPVQLARLAERAGEEHPEHVHGHADHEQQGRPVVDLAHEQATADVEGQLQGGGVRPRHLDAVQRCVGALVGGEAHRRVEPQGEEGAGDQQHDEAVEGDLAQHEGPVVGEDLACAET